MAYSIRSDKTGTYIELFLSLYIYIYILICRKKNFLLKFYKTIKVGGDFGQSIRTIVLKSSNHLFVLSQDLSYNYSVHLYVGGELVTYITIYISSILIFIDSAKTKNPNWVEGIIACDHPLQPIKWRHVISCSFTELMNDKAIFGIN